MFVLVCPIGGNKDKRTLPDTKIVLSTGKDYPASLISDAHRTRPAPLSGRDGQGYCTAPFRWTVPSSPNCGRGLSPQSRTRAEYEPSPSPRGLYLNQDIPPSDGRVSGRQRPRTEAVCPVSTCTLPSSIRSIPVTMRDTSRFSSFETNT